MVVEMDPLGSEVELPPADNVNVLSQSSSATAPDLISGTATASPSKRASLVIGTAERNSKTGITLTLTPSSSLNFQEVNNYRTNQNGDTATIASNGSVSSDQVFVDGRGSKGPALSTQEEEGAKEFLEIVNGSRVAQGLSPLSWGAGVKFLMARKFNVRRALELYNQHQVSRHTEGLFNFNPDLEPLKSELNSGKFTVLPTRDLGGAAIAVFTAKMHQPSSAPHEYTLKLFEQGVVYQLDAALEDPITQRSGLILIYDMSDSKYSNFDYDLSIKILSLLKGGYPARLKKVLIVTAPLWFRAPFRILRLFVREKLRDRVFTVSVPQLGVHIPHSSLPRLLGGELEVNHGTWLQHCQQVLSASDLWGQFSHHTIPISQHLPEDKDNGSTEDDGNEEEDDDLNIAQRKMRRNGQSTPSPTPNSSASSGFSDDDSLPFEERSGLTLTEFVEHLKQKGRRGLLDEYAEIVAKNPDGSFNSAKMRGNISKNRYSDVLCYDHTRVILSTDGDSDSPSDYINANFVDGYKQKNAFISTQGPLPRTFGDFWQMVWEQTVVLIVMTTRAVERGRTKCGQYWPPDTGSSVTHEGFRIENLDVDTRPDFAITKLKITNLKTNESREGSHMQFLSWPDYGVPSSAAATLKFIQKMREEQAGRVEQLSAKWDGHPLGPPIVVHCSAGIGRTGTLLTMDICIRRLVDQGTIDVQGTVERIRSQRAYSIQVPEQYLFCHASMIEYALTNEPPLLTPPQIAGIPDLLAEARDMAVEREREMFLAAKRDAPPAPSRPPYSRRDDISVGNPSTGDLKPSLPPFMAQPQPAAVAKPKVQSPAPPANAKIPQVSPPVPSPKDPKDKAQTTATAPQPPPPKDPPATNRAPPPPPPQDTRDTRRAR